MPIIVISCILRRTMSSSFPTSLNCRFSPYSSNARVFQIGIVETQQNAGMSNGRCTHRWTTFNQQLCVVVDVIIIVIIAVHIARWWRVGRRAERLQLRKHVGPFARRASPGWTGGRRAGMDVMAGAVAGDAGAGCTGWCIRRGRVESGERIRIVRFRFLHKSGGWLQQFHNEI